MDQTLPRAAQAATPANGSRRHSTNWSSSRERASCTCTDIESASRAKQYASIVFKSGGNAKCTRNTLDLRSTLRHNDRSVSLPKGCTMDLAIMIEGQDGLNWPRWQRLARTVEDLG